MIREIINFTENLIADIPDVMQWKVKPDKGLHVFIDIDENGDWINKSLKKEKDYDYFDGRNEIGMWKECIRYQEATTYITMNKVKAFDRQQKIHSCSPFAIAYNFNFNDDDKKSLGIEIYKKGEKPTVEEKNANESLIREKRFEIVLGRIDDYKKNALQIFTESVKEEIKRLNDEVKQLQNTGETDVEDEQKRIDDYKKKALSIFNIEFDKTEEEPTLFSTDNEENKNEFAYKKQLCGFYSNINYILLKITKLPEYESLTNKDYIRINLRSIPIDLQEKFHNAYIKNEIFSGEYIKELNLGAVGFFTAYNSKKPFLRHKTSILKDGVNQRFSKEDALFLNRFEKLLKLKSLPNPLPIVIDNREINKEIVNLFNENVDPLPYRELLKRLFEKKNTKYLSDYYFLNSAI